MDSTESLASDTPLIKRLYWTRRELADELGGTTRTMDVMRAEGRGPPHIMLMGKILYPKAGVLKWLAAQENPAIFRGRRSAKTRKSAQAAADLLAKQAAKADALITFLIEKTPAEVSARVLSDITDLASAKAVIAKLAVAISVLAKQGLR